VRIPRKRKKALALRGMSMITKVHRSPE